MKGKRIVSVLTAAAVLIAAAAPAMAADSSAAAVTGTTASVAAVAESDLTVTASAASYTYEPTVETYYYWSGGWVKNMTTKSTYKNNKLKKLVTKYYDADGNVTSKDTYTYSNFNKYGDPKKEVQVLSDGTKNVLKYTYTYNKKGQMTKKVTSYSGGKDTTTYTYKNGVVRKEVFKSSFYHNTVVYNSKGAVKSVTMNIKWANTKTKEVYSNYDKNLNPKTIKITTTDSEGTVTKTTNTVAYTYYKGKYMKQEIIKKDSKTVYSGFVKIKN